MQSPIILFVKKRNWQFLHLAAGDEALQASADVTLTGSNLEVAVDDTRSGLVDC
jgi:hypothetical protein